MAWRRLKRRSQTSSSATWGCRRWSPKGRRRRPRPKRRPRSPRRPVRHKPQPPPRSINRPPRPPTNRPPRSPPPPPSPHARRTRRTRYPRHHAASPRAGGMESDAGRLQPARRRALRHRCDQQARCHVAAWPSLVEGVEIPEVKDQPVNLWLTVDNSTDGGWIRAKGPLELKPLSLELGVRMAQHRLGAACARRAQRGADPAARWPLGRLCAGPCQREGRRD